MPLTSNKTDRETLKPIMLPLHWRNIFVFTETGVITQPAMFAFRAASYPCVQGW